MLADGKLKKADREDPTQQLDALDGYGYFLTRNFIEVLKGIEIKDRFSFNLENLGRKFPNWETMHS